MDRGLCSIVSLIALCAALVAGMCQPAAAATLCVNPGGTKGCYSKIGAAVLAASPNDTIRVAAGTYKEDVVIGKPLSLVGANRRNTIIDATGLANGVYIDGIDNPGLADVVVRGFTVRNANFEGILVTNASFVTVWDNEVTDNDLSLAPSVPACPGMPSFETAEDFDCGEGVHLIGVDHSTVADNTIENNAGGILLSDETGATHDNLISGNVARNNPFDCGITLASHPPASGSGSPLGIVHNTIADNDSTHNGTQVPGAGAGVGIFTFLPGGTVSANVVINNRLRNNGLPGVAFHGHSPGENLNDNIIVGNQISGNGADTDDAATPGPTGINIFGISSITGTVISQNVIKDEADDIVANTPALVDVHLNILLGKQTGVDNLGTGTVNATENWWGCSGGPGAFGCASVSGPGVLFVPWLTNPFQGKEE
jgi:parallel beta-helix repeat protein